MKRSSLIYTKIPICTAVDHRRRDVTVIKIVVITMKNSFELETINIKKKNRAQTINTVQSHK